MTKFAERVKQLRVVNNKTIQKVSLDTTITIPTLWAYEHDKHSPSLPPVVILADYYSVSIDYLIGRTDKL